MYHHGSPRMISLSLSATTVDLSWCYVLIPFHHFSFNDPRKRLISFLLFHVCSTFISIFSGNTGQQIFSKALFLVSNLGRGQPQSWNLLLFLILPEEKKKITTVSITCVKIRNFTFLEMTFNNGRSKIKTKKKTNKPKFIIKQIYQIKSQQHLFGMQIRHPTT